MNYLNYTNALWDCFGFHITQVGSIFPNQATFHYWAIGPDCFYNERYCFEHVESLLFFVVVSLFYSK